MKAVPFDPEQAKAHNIVFYSLPQDIDYEQIDPLMRSILRRINASGMVWTAECCQGHPDYNGEGGWEHNTRPFLRLVTSAENLGWMMGHLVRSMRLRDIHEPINKARIAHVCTFQTYVWKFTHPCPYEQVMIYVEARNILDRDRGIEAFEQFSWAVSPDEECEAGILHPEAPVAARAKLVEK